MWRGDPKNGSIAVFHWVDVNDYGAKRMENCVRQAAEKLKQQATEIYFLI